jgi:hypothetical protein
VSAAGVANVVRAEDSCGAGRGDPGDADRALHLAREAMTVAEELGVSGLADQTRKLLSGA